MKILTMGLFTFLGALFSSCGEKNDRTETIQFNGAELLYKHYSKTTIETTLRRHEIAYKANGSKDEKIIIGAGPGEMEFFPSDKSILKGVDYTIIDTVSRIPENFPPTKLPHTLYLDPKVFSKEDYNSIVALVKDLYSKPIEQNKLVEWMDSDVLGLEKGNIYFTVYAIVHEKLSTFEPLYSSSNGTDWLKVTVNSEIYFRDVDKSGMPTEGYWDYTLTGDTLFYPDYVSRSKVDSLLMYKHEDGSLFSSRAKLLVPRKLN